MNNKKGYFGGFGGRYVPEMLVPALEELESAYKQQKNNSKFWNELDNLFNNYSGRPTPLYFAENMTKDLNGPRIYLKLEGLNHTGAHKINNVLGQMLLAKKMGKKEIIAETGAGQHGVATAAAAAKFGLKCKVFMGEVDVKRQYPNVYSMKLLGAEVVPVKFGQRTLKDAVNQALKYWIKNLNGSYYLMGSALGPHPYPQMVRDFQSVIGREIRKQIFEFENCLPGQMIACVGGGSNSIGMFFPFLQEKTIELIGVEAGGRGSEPGQNASRLKGIPKTGILQGYKSYFLQDNWGQILPTHSISAGLDYAGIGPELASLYHKKRVKFVNVSDDEALNAFKYLSRMEGIIPALESAHAVAYAIKTMHKYGSDQVVVINISGRGDKDIFISARELDKKNWYNFLTAEVENE